MRCWPNSTPTSPRDTRWAATVWVPRCGFHGVSSTARFTSGQLGKPNNDTRLPPRTVVRTNKACPEARLFPVTRSMLFGLEGPANRSADVQAFAPSTPAL
jgi:hypothetical protein